MRPAEEKIEPIMTIPALSGRPAGAVYPIVTDRRGDSFRGDNVGKLIELIAPGPHQINADRLAVAIATVLSDCWLISLPVANMAV